MVPEELWAAIHSRGGLAGSRPRSAAHRGQAARRSRGPSALVHTEASPRPRSPSARGDRTGL